MQVTSSLVAGNRRGGGSVVWACFAGLLVGCSPTRPADRPETLPITVVVAYQGQPVEQAVVTFVGENGYSASATTDAKGIARPWTFEAGDGVVSGRYRVTVLKLRVDVTPDPKDPDEAPPLKVERTHLVPERYGSASTTELTAEVRSDGPREFAFALVD